MISTNKQTYTRFYEIGTNKRLAQHILLENTYQNNLLSDISQVDYTKENLGSTNLQLLDGQPMSLDNIYVYGYLSIEQVVYRGNRVSLSTGKKSQAKRIIAIMQWCSSKIFGAEAHVSIVHTAAYEGHSVICKTIEKIERDTENKIIN